MKTALMLFFLILYSIGSGDDIVHEYDYNSKYSGYGKLSENNEKFYCFNEETRELSIHNDDHSVWKSITINILSGSHPEKVFFIRQGLFTDDGKVTFMCQFRNGVTKLINEDNEVLFDFEDITRAHEIHTENGIKIIGIKHDYEGMLYTNNIYGLYNGIIEKERIFLGTEMRPVKLKNSEIKLYNIDIYNSKVVFYNTDYSIYKSFSIPYNSGYVPHFVKDAYEGLFTTDDRIAVRIVYEEGQWNYRMIIIAEDEEILLDEEGGYVAKIYKDNDKYKMLVNIFTHERKSNKVYSLPGTITSIEEEIQVPEKYNLLNTYPNPSNGTAVINYELPKGENSGVIRIYNIKGQTSGVYRVNRNFSNLRIDTSGFASGVYMYTLKTDNGKMSLPAKFVVTK